MVTIEKFEFTIDKKSYNKNPLLKLNVNMSSDLMRDFPNYCRSKRIDIKTFDGPMNGFYKVGFEFGLYDENEKTKLEQILNNLNNSTLPLMMDDDKLKYLSFVCGMLIKFCENK